MESTSGETGKAYSIARWIEANNDKFLPPVCLRMMYDKGQMKCFFVGGPNERCDYHLECGEELFYMWRGDMVLKVVEKGVHRDLVIKEGQMFLLPARIPHSPQRQADTVGLVFERQRAPKELDGLRYFVEENGKSTTDVLYEKWFYCKDLASLGHVIQNFFESEQSKTGKPIPGAIPEVRPLVVDEKTTLTDPIDFLQWVEDHKDKIKETGYIRVYPESHQFQTFVLGEGKREVYCKHAEAWIWQLEGESEVSYTDVKRGLHPGDGFLVPADERFTVKQETGSFAFVAYQDPSNCSTWVN